MSNPHDPAFPLHTPEDNFNSEERHYGLTKREYFAAMALQGLLSRDIDSSRAALRAVELADQLIAELNKTDGGK